VEKMGLRRDDGRLPDVTPEELVEGHGLVRGQGPLDLVPAGVWERWLGGFVPQKH